MKVTGNGTVPCGLAPAKARNARPAVSKKLPWRNSAQLRGNRSQLVVALRACNDGARVWIDVKLAMNLIEICDQAIHTEAGHGPSAAEIAVAAAAITA